MADSSHVLENPNNIKKGRLKSSWVWEFFDSELRSGEQWAICKLNIMGTNDPCRKEYKTGVLLKTVLII